MKSRAVIVGGVLVSVAAAYQQFDASFRSTIDHPAIAYATRPVHDPVGALNRAIQDGAAHLKFEMGHGYLRSTLQALNVSNESQLAVFSKTSLQADRISPYTPRTIFFSDAVTIAWMRGGFIELAAQDPEQGVVFYTLDQVPVDKPVFKREGDRCLRCHASEPSLSIPGMVVRSLYTAQDGSPMLVHGGYTTDHRSPFEQRWGGWYVTGEPGSVRHLGNAMIGESDQPESIVTKETLHQHSLSGKIDPNAYLSPYSDIVALLVFDHQMYMANLLTRVGWEIRLAFYEKQKPNLLLTLAPDGRRNLAGLLTDTASELVDYLLFIDEAPLAGPIRGVSGFGEKFSALGPQDRKGRSLRQFDLKQRLMRYPCSYMIYTEAFDRLPVEARGAIYERMWQILSGREKGRRYARLSVADRRAIAEILLDTKKGLPGYFRTSDFQ